MIIKMFYDTICTNPITYHQLSQQLPKYLNRTIRIAGLLIRIKKHYFEVIVKNHCKSAASRTILPNI